MKIIINTSSMIPIYEQIMEAVKKEIADENLVAGDPLPSVRSLAAELRISALTVKKAYDGLEAEGFTSTIHGKGTYVTAANRELVRERQRREIEETIDQAVSRARSYGIEDKEIREILELILES
ncbi:MAG: GntR family transcriptional regulator [Lachnospiraceae bacterium]|nr:GntR family transcriptional regulator [Lachnospiraceae bacterium]